MDQSARRAQTAKGGPRVLTIAPALDGTDIETGIFHNCPACGDPPDGYGVWGEAGVLNEYGPLVHGWYVLETDINIFWQQVNPADVRDTNPENTGRKLSAGSCLPFFVDESIIDGIVVISVSSGQEVSTAYTPTTYQQGLIRIVRVDTTKLMSETGDSATDMIPPASNACGSAPDVV